MFYIFSLDWYKISIEDCNIDTDCILNNECKNGKCSGFNEGENCTKTYECSVGLFCDKDSKKCLKQKKEGETCKEGWDCQNYLGCYRGRCIKLGILKPGVINNEKTSPFPNGRRELLCTTGIQKMDIVLKLNIMKIGWDKMEKKRCQWIH